jgi:hypothetical protein
VLKNPRSLAWSPDVCAKCAVPAILRANGSSDLVLEVTVAKRLGLMKSVHVAAHCRRHDRSVDDPYVGCPDCRAEWSVPGADQVGDL